MPLPYKVIITHISSGISTCCNLERSLHRTKNAAMNMLKSKLAVPASPFINRVYTLDSEPKDQLKEFDEKYTHGPYLQSEREKRKANS